LADHIAIVYKGRLVCEGPSTSLKARFGESYTIRSYNDSDDDNLIWRTSNSAEATRKLLELEEMDNDNIYDVAFPTLEQVFLKVTSNTAVHATGGDGFVGEQEDSTVIDEKIFALETEAARDIDLDVGHGTGFIRQVRALFTKRYILLQQKAGWISYGINLIIPIIIAAALVKFFYRFSSLQTCEMNMQRLRNPPDSAVQGSPYESSKALYYSSKGIYAYAGQAPILLGPESSWYVYLSRISPYLAKIPSSIIFRESTEFRDIRNGHC
jgi:ATP-binding cassette, subfamily A (ABC1), member 3